MAGSGNVGQNLDKFASRLTAALVATAQKHGASAEAWAKNPPFPLRPLRPDEAKETAEARTRRVAKKSEQGSEPVSPPPYQEMSGSEESLKWRDQTALARKGIFHKVTAEGGILKITLAHSMSYGVYLELANQRRYAVIEPAVKIMAPKFIDEVTRLLK
jgi:hypothetical protein